MCFYNDYDWVAIIDEQACRRADGERMCIECSRQISSGEWHIDIWQQEYEECQICEDSESDDYDEEQDAATCKHDYGETFAAAVCRGCGLILAAIYDLEKAEGCPEHARQPCYGALREELWQDHQHTKGHYQSHAIAMFPELRDNKLFDW